MTASRWETDRKDQDRKTTENTKSLTVKVRPEMADHLTRLAKEMQTSRPVLVSEIFDDGYVRLSKAEKRIKIDRQRGDTPHQQTPDATVKQPPMSGISALSPPSY